MKNVVLISFFSLFILSCQETQIGEKIDSKRGKSNEGFLNETLFYLDQALDNPSNKNNSLVLDANPLGDTVNLYPELVKLFHPDNFKCKCEGSVRDRIVNFKRNGQNTPGFVPDVLLKDAFYSEKAVLLKNNSGGNLLAHGLYYITPEGAKSKFLFVDASTAKNFNVMDFLEIRSDLQSNFIFSYDCSGFLSAALAVTANIRKNSLKSSAQAAAEVKGSLTVIGGVMYSPLYLAYTGLGKFSSDSAEIIKLRIDILKDILKLLENTSMPSNSKIHLNSNYRVIVTSNSGTQSFNGKGELGISAGASFGAGSIDGQVQAKASLERKTNYSAYSTYITDGNVNAEPLEVTKEEINMKITSLGTSSKKLPL